MMLLQGRDMRSVRVQGTSLPVIPTTLSQPAREFILRCLQRDQQKRETLASPVVSRVDCGLVSCRAISRRAAIRSLDQGLRARIDCNVKTALTLPGKFRTIVTCCSPVVQSCSTALHP